MNALATDSSLYEEVEKDIWAWIHEFLTVPNEFYNNKFPPCPYARAAVLARTVDVHPWRSGNVREFIREQAISMRDSATLTTRVLAFPPKTQDQFGLSDFVENLNIEMIPGNVFLNTGIAKTSVSRYPGTRGKQPYFLVVANSIDAVLSGAESLAKSDYYKDWPKEHYAIVVERRARMAKQYGAK